MAAWLCRDQERLTFTIMLEKIPFEPNVIQNLFKMPAFVTRTCYHHYLFNSLHLIRLTECVRVPKSFITKAVNQRWENITYKTIYEIAEWRRTRSLADQISPSVFSSPWWCQRLLRASWTRELSWRIGPQLIIVGSFQIFPEAFSRQFLESFATSTSRDILWTLLALIAAGGRGN